MTPAAPHTRELAARDSDGIQVVLLWHPDENALSVSVDDTRADDRFQFVVAPDRALDAFYHPFAYARSVERAAPMDSLTRVMRGPTLDEAAPTGVGH